MKLAIMLVALPAMASAVSPFGGTVQTGATSPFDGKWTVRVDTIASSKNYQFTLSNGVYECQSCTPQDKVAADGLDHYVAGHHDYDSVSAVASDAHTVTLVYKLRGETIWQEVDKVSADGKSITATQSWTNAGKPFDGTVVLTRTAAAPAGAHAASGSWKMTGAAALTTNALTRTLTSKANDVMDVACSADTVEMTVDGAEVTRADSSTVALKRIDASTLEETTRVNGAITEINRMTLSPDQKFISVLDTNVERGRTIAYTLEKQ